MTKRLTQEEFIKRAKAIHGDFYDYSEVEYRNYDSKIKIICPNHGVFQQSPLNHISGHKCPECSKISRADKKRKKMDVFIKEANLIHKNKYDYSKVEYKNNGSKVKIICPIHGEFFQRPSDHLSGHGCVACAKRLTLHQFIKKSKKIHKNKYDYSKVEYVNNKTKVKIICPEHGEFLQTPNSHLKGFGCTLCGRKNAIEKQIKNRTTTRSLTEDNLYKTLEKAFSSVFRNFRDPRYPFRCDFYIPERDLFIEYNGYYMHGNEWYDGRIPICRDRVNNWMSKDSRQYIRAIKTYTKEDVLKRKTAKKNNLNYVVLWNEQDIEDWFTLGCPDGHDGDGMYTWKK